LPYGVADLRILFMGTPELARTSLQAILATPGFKVVGVITQPDKPRGRDLKLSASPVKDLALAEQLPVLQPERARDEQLLQSLQALAPDLIAVAAYGQILPQRILDLPHFGCLNVHTSLLPKYRGAAPIQRAILNDELETGVTIMKMDIGMDTGPILAQEKTMLLPKDTSQTLHDRLAAMGANLLVRVIPDFVAGKITPRPQPSEGVSYAPKITKAEGLIDWNAPARVIWNHVRGLVPWPGAFTHLLTQAAPQLLKVWDTEVIEQTGPPGEILAVDQGIVVGCARNAVRILALQREGGRRLTATQFQAGYSLKPGDRLG
jgi:methionyl-tRNA formyltransferase